MNAADTRILAKAMCDGCADVLRLPADMVPCPHHVAVAQHAISRLREMGYHVAPIMQSQLLRARVSGEHVEGLLHGPGVPMGANP